LTLLKALCAKQKFQNLQGSAEFRATLPRTKIAIWAVWKPERKDDWLPVAFL
jgi:hypothetical protein